MMRSKDVVVLATCLLVGSACSDNDDDNIVIGPNLDGGLDGGGVDANVPSSDASTDAATPGPTSPLTSFFVTSDKSPNGNLGGLSGADARCQRLAAAAGVGAKTWRAFLSAESDPASGNQPVEARTRIGKGPWYNARGVLVASDVSALLALTGNPELFVDEYGAKINGQWIGSPMPNEHDVLTGTALDGGVAVGFTCESWTSSADAGTAYVGHTDGLGPNQDATPPRNSWFSAHESAGCNDTLPRGGAGRLYCFASN